jgi:hypothetical protein
VQDREISDTRGCRRFPCLALFVGVWFYFSLLSAVFSFVFVCKQSYFPFMSIKKLVPYFCVFSNVWRLLCNNMADCLNYRSSGNNIICCGNKISHFWDRPVPIFSDVRFSYLALVEDKKIMCVLPANACCTVFINCPPILHAFPF